MKLTYRANKALENIKRIASTDRLPFYEEAIINFDYLVRGFGFEAIQAKAKLDKIAQLTHTELQDMEIN